jgi:8-oxo-dGTP pyrophosphatase MutT (NUDIX family)
MDIPVLTRYQAAILRGRNILLVCHRQHDSGRTYWPLPGGGIEAGESEIGCVQREVREETHLDVVVEGLLLDESRQCFEGKSGGGYQRFKTYLCHPISGQEAAPGYEPEPEVAAIYAIVEVGWFNLDDESTWNESILSDPIAAPALRRIRAALGKKAD